MSQPKTKTTNQAKGERYNNVPEMVRALSADKEFAESLAKELSDRNIIDMLMALRATQGLSQKDIADRMGCTQSRISKLENGKDDDLRIGDFHAYTEALGLEMAIFLCKKDRTVVEEVRYHAFAIRRALLSMAKIAGEDPSIAKGVRGFFREAAFNLARIVKEATKTISSAAATILPPMPHAVTPLIQVASSNAEDADDCGNDANSERASATEIDDERLAATH